MLSDNVHFYLATHRPHHAVHADPVLLLCMVAFFSWVAYLLWSQK